MIALRAPFHAADRIVVDGFTMKSRTEHGTTFCFVSCDEARIGMALATRLDESEEVCDALAAAVGSIFDVEPLATPAASSLTGCTVLPLPTVGDEAFVQLVPDGAACGGSRCVQVVVNTGSTETTVIAAIDTSSRTRRSQGRRDQGGHRRCPST